MTVEEGISKLGYKATKVITCRMVLKEKTTADCVFEKVKARLVAGGHLQDREIYDNGSSPTASTTVVMIEAALAAKFKNAVAHIDFSGAFLNATMPDSGNHMVHMKEFCTNRFVRKFLLFSDIFLNIFGLLEKFL